MAITRASIIDYAPRYGYKGKYHEVKLFEETATKDLTSGNDNFTAYQYNYDTGIVDNRTKLGKALGTGTNFYHKRYSRFYSDVDGGAGNDTISAGSGYWYYDYLAEETGEETRKDYYLNFKFKGGIGNDSLVGDLGWDTLRGGADDDTIRGGDDYLPDSHGDYLYGDGGNDWISGGTGTDKIWGGNDNDTIYGDANNDTIYGNAGDDYLSGGEGNDSLMGGADNDTLSGDLGYDTIYGNAGDDLLKGGDENDTIYGGTGSDIIYGNQGLDELHGGDNDDIIFTGPLNEGQADVVSGGNGFDTFYIGEFTSPHTVTTTTESTVWSSIVDLGLSLAGDISDLSFQSSDNRSKAGGGKGLGPTAKLAKEVIPMVFDIGKSIFKGNWKTTQTITETIEDHTAITYAKILDFNPRQDVAIIPLATTGDINIETFASDDSFKDISIKYKNGKTFAELNFDSSLNLSSNAREFYKDSLLKSAIIMDSNGVTYGGKIGDDQYDLTSRLDSDFATELQAVNGRFMLFGAVGPQMIEGDNGENFLFGSDHGDVIYGYDVNLTTSSDPTERSQSFAPGLDAKDEIYAYGGDDLIYAGNGDNIIYGGTGENTVSYEDANGSGINVDLAVTVTTTDDLNGSVQFANGFKTSSEVTGTDSLFNIQNIIGTQFADTLKGDDFNNVFDGLEDSDQLYGRGGNDKLNGNLGNDTLDGGTGDDTLIGGEGTDTAVFSDVRANYVLGSTTIDSVEYVSVANVNDGTDLLTGVEQLEFADMTIYSPSLNIINGTDGTDILTGTANDDMINGLSGSDTIKGEGGNDTLNGGLGLDALYGGDGNDIINGGHSADILHGGDGADTFVFDASGYDGISDFQSGVDTIQIDKSRYGISDYSDISVQVIGNSVSVTWNSTHSSILLSNTTNFSLETDVTLV